MKLFATGLALAILGSCSTPQAPAPVAVVTPTGPATSEQIAALEQQVDAQKTLRQRAAGAVWGAEDANAANPAGLPKEAVTAQLEEAQSVLPAPTPEQKTEKALQNSRILAGELEKVKQEMGLVITENEKLRLQFANSEREQEKLKVAAEKERQEAAGRLQAQFDAFTKRVEAAQAAAKKAEDDARNSVMKSQVAWLNRAAAACGGVAILAAGLAMVFGGPLALRAVAPFAGVALFAALSCFGLAQIVGQGWFKWAILSVVVLGFGIAGWWVWQKYRDGKLGEATQKKLAKVQGVVSSVVPVLDDAYDNADEQLKQLLDAKIFSVLKDKMDRADKATVHEIRAENATKTEGVASS